MVIKIQHINIYDTFFELQHSFSASEIYGRELSLFRSMLELKVQESSEEAVFLGIGDNYQKAKVVFTDEFLNTITKRIIQNAISAKEVFIDVSLEYNMICCYNDQTTTREILFIHNLFPVDEELPIPIIEFFVATLISWRERMFQENVFDASEKQFFWRICNRGFEEFRLPKRYEMEIIRYETFYDYANPYHLELDPTGKVTSRGLYPYNRDIGKIINKIEDLLKKHETKIYTWLDSFEIELAK